MKYLIITTVGLLLPVSVYGICPPLTDEQIQDWDRELNSGDATVVFELADRLYHMPREPWSNSARQLLLNVIHRYERVTEQISNNEPIVSSEPIPRDQCGEYVGQLIEMSTWQRDERFIPFMVQYVSQRLTFKALAELGEPAFEAIIPYLKKDGWHSQHGAVEIAEMMLAGDSAFLRSGKKRTWLKEELYRLARPQSLSTQTRAIRALRYFNDGDVIRLLESIPYLG